MSEISDAERRRILREKRQQKFSKGGASTRLAKITGQTENSFLSTESPLDSRESSYPAQETKSSTGNEDSTKQMDELLAKATSKTTSKASSPPGSAEQQSGNPELDLFAQIAKLQQNANNGTDPADPSGAPDIFAQLMASMQQDESKGGSPGATAQQPIDPAVVEAHNIAVNKLKSYTILVKWLFFLLPYLYYITRSARDAFQHNAVNYVLDKSNFFTVFTTFEIVALSVYYQLLMSAEKSHNVNTLDNNSKILKLVSMVPPGLVPIPNLRGKVVQALQYWDVVSMYLTDLCFAIVLAGFFQYYHSM
ncbi:LAQU0S09e01750g1_1 [Lachancea quebecensis]|uniref:Golgi to ER traffic protein 2 n=1 Tax=Lachancea quebecensis TaxID=1654605 RepID=A0A0P1KTX8_9SACH|nr:LAQU0S09e01750g1_1 [Lachancea quebecensis]